MAIYIHVSSNIFHLFKPHQKKKNETLQQNSKGVPLTGASMDGPWVSPFLYHQPSPHWKSRVAQLDANAIGLMHHLVFGINFQFHLPHQSCLDLPPHSPVKSSLSSPSTLSIHSFFCSFTLSLDHSRLKPTFSTIYPSHHNRLLV